MSELRPAPRPVPIAEICAALGLPPLPGVVTGLSLNTSLVQRGDLFAALPGAHTHGAAFTGRALELGAAAVLTDPRGALELQEVGVPVLVVEDPRATLGALSALVYPGPRPHLIGITGTNGKTTTAHCVAACAEVAGLPTAVLGTLGIHFRELSDYSGRTTPEAPSLHAALARVAEAGAALAAMEVSSHALALHRVDGLRFAVAVFLGLTQDHLDFHPTMEDYFEAKAALFGESRADTAVINIDDEWGVRLAGRVAIPSVTYGLRSDADWHPREVTVDAQGRTSFVAVHPTGAFPVVLAMPGDFNIANSLAALASAAQLGLDPALAAGGLAQVRVPGRFERIPNALGIAAYVDYAHTPDAVARALDVARASTRGRVITVLGCGGDRDPAKRPLMGSAAATRSDLLIVTDDNPRSEVPAGIRAAVLDGVPASARTLEIGDRALAIAEAVQSAEPGDCLMVLGKGHETGQEIAGVLHAFDDRLVLQQALEVRA